MGKRQWNPAHSHIWRVLRNPNLSALASAAGMGNPLPCPFQVLCCRRQGCTMGLLRRGPQVTIYPWKRKGTAMRMMDTIYLVDEYTGKIIPVEAGRYRVIRNNDEETFDILKDHGWYMRRPKKLAGAIGSSDLGYIELG
ncbi:hypothetical protein RHECIAT_CH0003326 [Rhizobium etli CIAT 652]|uniref:Uncharacterized protein n=1 Tax=Rhizobium etli (strain CIAT 652) TaxID=491916 RepID=B3PVQ4_RHIE6|nr:hypothetical protein RHECIAT_CH0003326 [Rhizobium etli CIAT 652]